MAAIALPLLAIAATLVVARVIAAESDDPDTGPLSVSEVPAPGAASTSCTDLLGALPDPLAGLPRRALAGPDAPPGVAAWSEPPIVLRCGVPTPAELTCAAALQEVDGVAWLPIDGAGATTFLAADRPVRVAFTVPDGTGTGPWQELSRIVAAALPERAICEQGVLLPVDGD